jgi:hypothetical protein
MVSNDLMAKTLTEKCISKEVRKIIGNIQDQAEIWDTLDMCYESHKNL